MKICSVKGCSRLHSAKTYCTKHYQRWLKHGNPLYVNPNLQIPRTDKGQFVKGFTKYPNGRPSTQCLAASCTASAWARGWCLTHYSRWRVYGNAEQPSIKDSLAVKLPRLIDKSIPNGCWHWLGTLQPTGYGMIMIEGQNRCAHRVIYELLISPISQGLALDHVCHNEDMRCRGNSDCTHRRCVNPAHLEPVTPQENNRRRIEKIDRLFEHLKGVPVL